MLDRSHRVVLENAAPSPKNLVKNIVTATVEEEVQGVVFRLVQWVGGSSINILLTRSRKALKRNLGMVFGRHGQYHRRETGVGNIVAPRDTRVLPITRDKKTRHVILDTGVLVHQILHCSSPLSPPPALLLSHASVLTMIDRHCCCLMRVC